MPIYEYLCPDGHRFEVVQRFSDDPVTICEDCGRPVQRVLFAPAVHYKGKGFYATDYGRKGANGNKPDSSAASESGSKDGAAGVVGQRLRLGFVVRVQGLGLQELRLEELVRRRLLLEEERRLQAGRLTPWR